MVKKRCTFKNLEENLKKPGRNSENLENFQKTFGHPVGGAQKVSFISICIK